MGQMKKIYTELQNQGYTDAEISEMNQDLAILDFQNTDAPASEQWYEHQDTTLEAEELARIESDAELQEYRSQGYM